MSAAIPHGIEVLVKKAAVDPAFRKILLERRAAAAELIELPLQPEEEAMLASVPAQQLESIIAQTIVPQEHRRTFLGTVGVAMLALATGVVLVGMLSPAGIRAGKRATDSDDHDSEDEPRSSDLSNGERNAGQDEVDSSLDKQRSPATVRKEEKP